ncbi:MAG: hypothetical protein H6945_16545 [Zoogloeaceae bacterium]|nr:hypothetical protein [Zoogloeaceae bacterium]
MQASEPASRRYQPLASRKSKMHTKKLTVTTVPTFALLIAMALGTGTAMAADVGLTSRAGEVPQCPDQGPIVVEPCAVDETLIIFDQPVYDDDGLFVVCTEKVPYCVPSGLEPEGDKPAAGGTTMLKMLGDFQRDGHKLSRTLEELALRSKTRDPLADTTITCNDDTHICTCVSDADGDCEAKLAAICDTAEPFGSNGGVGTDCPSVDD